jgi:hypothetical protein
MILQSQTDLDKRLVRGMGSGDATPHVFSVEAFWSLWLFGRFTTSCRRNKIIVRYKILRLMASI